MQRPVSTSEVEWREVPSRPGYMVSSLGQVWSPRSGKIIRGIEAGQMKYLCIDFWKEGREYVHRMVCEAFHGPAPTGAQVRHLDGDNRNNKPENLAWGTIKENYADKVRHGTAPLGQRNPMAKLTPNAVAEMRQQRHQHGTPFHKLAKQYNVSTMTAYRAVTAQSWSK